MSFVSNTLTALICDRCTTKFVDDRGRIFSGITPEARSSQARDKGWITVYEGQKRYHYCPKCSKRKED